MSRARAFFIGCGALDIDPETRNVAGEAGYLCGLP